MSQVSSRWEQHLAGLEALAKESLPGFAAATTIALPMVVFSVRGGTSIGTSPALVLGFVAGVCVGSGVLRWARQVGASSLELPAILGLYVLFVGMLAGVLSVALDGFMGLPTVAEEPVLRALLYGVLSLLIYSFYRLLGRVRPWWAWLVAHFVTWLVTLIALCSLAWWAPR